MIAIIGLKQEITVTQATNHIKGEMLDNNELQQRIWDCGDKIIPMLSGLSLSEIERVLSYIKDTVQLFPIQLPY